ncbi:MAG TPA: hypothetical protein VF519_02320 [Mycobacteriales bacterium]
MNGALVEVEVADGVGLLLLPHVDAMWSANGLPEVESYVTRDGGQVDGRPPPARVFTKVADLDLLRALDDARHYVWAAQVQVERFVTAFRRISRSTLPPSPAEIRQSSQAFAEAEFLLNAAAQVEKSLRLLADGPAFSEPTAFAVRTLRNLHEHWEQHRASFASPSLPKKRAGATFATAYPDEVPWSFRWSAGTGHFISVLRVEDLWDELESIDIELSRRYDDLVAGTGLPHVPGDPQRAPRPIPEPAADGTVAFATLTQNLTL